MLKNSVDNISYLKGTCKKFPYLMNLGNYEIYCYLDQFPIIDTFFSVAFSSISHPIGKVNIGWV